MADKLVRKMKKHLAVMAGGATSEKHLKTVAARLPDNVPGSRPHFGADSP
jgi:hypothetical protein